MHILIMIMISMMMMIMMIVIKDLEDQGFAGDENDDEN